MVKHYHSTRHCTEVNFVLVNTEISLDQAQAAFVGSKSAVWITEG